MAYHGYDPGDHINWYQSPQLGLFPTSPTGYSGGYYCLPSSHPHVTQFPSHSSYLPLPSQFPFQPSYSPPPPPPSHTIINGFVFPYQFPSTHTHHSPDSNPNPWIYPSISQSHSYDPSVTSVNSHFVSTKTMPTSPVYHSAPSIPTFQSPSVSTFVPQHQFTDPKPRPLHSKPFRGCRCRVVMGAKVRVSKKTRNPDLLRDVGKYLRSKRYHRRGLWVIKAKNGDIFPCHNAKETVAIMEELHQLLVGQTTPITEPEPGSSPLKFGSLPAGSVALTAANGSSSMLSASSRGIRISEKPNFNLSPHEVILGLNKDFATALITGNHSEHTTTAVVTEELVLNVDKTIAEGVSGVTFSDIAVGEDDNEDKDDEGGNECMIFGSSAASKKFLKELQRESNTSSYLGAESYGDHSFSYNEDSQRVDGQIVTVEGNDDLMRNNKEGLLEKLRDMSWPENAKWVDNLTSDIEQEQPVDVHDGLTGELAFYTQALTRMRMAFEKLQLMGLPFLRPEDYYAELAKSESQLGKVKSQFLVEMTTNLTQSSLSQVSTTLNLNFQDVRRSFESFLSNVIKLYNLSSLTCKVGAEIWPPDDGEWLDLDGETYYRVVRGFLDNINVKELAPLIINAQKLESSTIVVDRSCCCGIVIACVVIEFSDKEHNILDEVNAQGGILGRAVHVLFKSMSQFNDIDFLLNPSDGNRDCAVVAVDKIVPYTKGRRSHFICAQVENINEQESKELLNSFPCQEEYDMRSKEDLDEVEASSIPPLIPFMPFAMKLDHLDKERMVFRRSTYQKILAMEKKGAQVIECDPKLPVDNLLSSAICLVWYDCRNIGKNTTALDKASSCLPLYIESLATNILILLSITFCSCMTLKTRFHKHINRVLQVTKSILQSAIDAVTHDSPHEIDIPSWKEVFNSLVMLEKNLNQFHDFCVDRDLKNIGEAFSIYLCCQLKTQRVDDAANKRITQNMAFIVCGVHSLSSILGVCAKGGGKFGVKAHSDGRTFYAYQFACISVQHVVDQIIEMSNTGGGDINVPKFKIFASHLGITTFSVSALQQFGHESLSQPIMVEVYAAPEIDLHDIFLVPGTSYVLTLNGDPTIGVKVEFTILALLQIEYQNEYHIDPIDVKAVIAITIVQLYSKEAAQIYKKLNMMTRSAYEFETLEVILVECSAALDPWISVIVSRVLMFTTSGIKDVHASHLSCMRNINALDHFVKAIRSTANGKAMMELNMGLFTDIGLHDFSLDSQSPTLGLELLFAKMKFRKVLSMKMYMVAKNMVASGATTQGHMLHDKVIEFSSQLNQANACTALGNYGHTEMKRLEQEINEKCVALAIIPMGNTDLVSEEIEHHLFLNVIFQVLDFSTYLDDNLDTFAYDLGDNSLAALHCIVTTVVEMLNTRVVGWLHLILCVLTYGELKCIDTVWTSKLKSDSLCKIAQNCSAEYLHPLAANCLVWNYQFLSFET